MNKQILQSKKCLTHFDCISTFSVSGPNFVSMVNTRGCSSSKRIYHEQSVHVKEEVVDEIIHDGEILRKGDFVMISPIKDWRTEVNKSLNAKNYSEKYDGVMSAYIC